MDISNRRSNALDYHAARVLILIDAFTVKGKGIDGLTKLAKLDFLLRYPVLLEKLAGIVQSPKLDLLTQPTTEERMAVESRMIRYKYGPWDDRYYPILGLLIGAGLVRRIKGKGKIRVETTELGRSLASSLSATGEWQVVALRSSYLTINFDATGNRLKEMIYEHLPEIVDRPQRTLI